MTDTGKRIHEAQSLLAALNFDRERYNERSALVLLALLRLTPDLSWAQANDPLIGVTPVMDWLREHYDKDYKPNTRETVRRQTLHQFVEAGLVLLNPDDPERPVNSPKSCYQISPEALGVVRAFGTSHFPELLQAHLEKLPGLRAEYDRAREMHRIPVTLPNGSEETLSPGGQNILIKQMIEDFCAYFTPGGQVLYVGDADEKWMVFDAESLARLGVSVDSHGKMPDLVVYLPDRNWLVLLEAASSHGPVDGKRRGELQGLFGGSTAGLVYVSCFPSREEMRKYLSQIAWETEVWCADNPTHLIHFNGERFLGPYEV